MKKVIKILIFLFKIILLKLKIKQKTDFQIFKTTIMKKILILFAIFFITDSYAQTKLYVHPDGDNYAANTKTIAEIKSTT